MKQHYNNEQLLKLIDITRLKGTEHMEMDDHYMYCLTEQNYLMIQQLLKEDDNYKFECVDMIRKLNVNQKPCYSEYEEIIAKIISENSTRTSRESKNQIVKILISHNTNFLNRIRNGDCSMVDEIVDKLKSLGLRREQSLVSKICKYFEEALFNTSSFSINDSVIRSVIPYYLKIYNIDCSLDIRNNNFKYFQFNQLLTTLVQKSRISSLQQLDRIIWYSYKNDKVRMEITKAHVFR